MLTLLKQKAVDSNTETERGMSHMKLLKPTIQMHTLFVKFLLVFGLASCRTDNDPGMDKVQVFNENNVGLNIERVFKDSVGYTIMGNLVNQGSDSIEILPNDHSSFVCYFKIAFFKDNEWSDWKECLPKYYVEFPDHIVLEPNASVNFRLNSRIDFGESDNAFEGLKLKFSRIDVDSVIVDYYLN